MEIYRSIDEIQSVENSVLTIGSFDGLHKGHQEIIKKVVNTAQALDFPSVVITFDPHPIQVLMNNTPEKFDLLIDVDKKLELLEKLNIDITCVIPFDLEFSNISATEFLYNIVIPYFKPFEIIVGYDHHFGHDREGDGEFLKTHSENGNYKVDIMTEIRDEDEIISSTHIRHLVADGNVRRASFELGWVYGFKADVVRGSGRGQKLNYPTANFIPTFRNQLLPKNGVYFARGLINDLCVYGMCNLGYRPTFGEEKFVMEIHFIENFDEELYDKTIEVQFLERIRDEITFDSPEELISQLKKDREYCLSRINVYTEEVTHAT